MRKTYVAVGALLIGSGFTLSALAQPNEINTQTSVVSTVTYSNTLAATVDARSTNTIDITIQGKVGVAGVVEPSSIGQSLVDSKQILDENTLTFLEVIDPITDWPVPTVINNTVSLGEGGGAFVNVEGNIGVNLNAGDNNAQDNSAAITTVQSSEQGLKADVVRLQEAVDNIFNDNSLTLLSVTNTITIGSLTFDNASGNVNANLSAGHNIAQANGLAVSVADNSSDSIVLASSNVGTLQNASQNETNIGNDVNTVQVGDIATNFTGNLGLNVAIGANLLQSNSLGVTAISQ